MMRGIFVFFTLASVIVFPWPFTALLALAMSFSEPLVPLAAGIFADTLYYIPHSQTLPFFTLYGAIVAIIATLVRSRLRTGSIRK